jgi:hypothetical protein
LPELPAFGRAPAREEIFETISEFNAAIGILGGGLEAAGGIWAAFEVEIGFSEAGRGVVGGVDEVFEGCVEASDERVVGDGFEAFAVSAGAGTLFADRSRTFSNILEVSGVTGGFEVGFEGAAVGAFDSVFVDAALGGAGGFDALFATGGELAAGFDGIVGIGVFFVAIGIGFTGFGAAFVDFALVVDFFISGKSTSIGSEMTFLGLPLFLTTSADILCTDLALGRRLERSWDKGVPLHSKIDAGRFRVLGS